MSWRNCHLLVGGIGLVLFVLQGQYMAHALHVNTLPDGPRMLYRSAHIYFLLSCVANIGIGSYMPKAPVMNYLQRLIAVVVMVAPALLLWSFFIESTHGTLLRPVARTGLFLLFGSAVLLVLQEGYRRFKSIT
jgi:hypothetical protein